MKDSLDTAANFQRDSAKSIEKWHRNGRNLYAITPRFPLGASKDMMKACQQLKKDHPDVWFNSHLNENPTEIKDTKAYHEVPDYLASFEKYDLLACLRADTPFGPRTTSIAEFPKLEDLWHFVRCRISSWAVDCSALAKSLIPSTACGSHCCDVGAGTAFSSIVNVLDNCYKSRHGK